MMAERFIRTPRKIFFTASHITSRRPANSAWEFPIANRLNIRRSASLDRTLSKWKGIFDANGTRLADVTLRQCPQRRAGCTTVARARKVALANQRRRRSTRVAGALG